MSEALRPLVVIGVGNVMLGDDGIGVRVVEGLRHLAGRDPSALPQATRLVDGGSMLDELPSTVRDARGLVLVDAVHLGGPEGSVSVHDGGAIAPTDANRGLAPDSVAEFLAVARLMGWLPEQVALVGIEVERTEFGTDLSPAIRAAIPRAIESVRAELDLMDEPFATHRLAVAAPMHPGGAQA